MNHQIINNNGGLTAYGLHCGYVEKKTIRNFNYELNKSCGVYIVSIRGAKDIIAEKVFDTLAQARAFIRQHI